MRIIGTDESALKRITCGDCASIIEYTKSEVSLIKHSYDYLGDYETTPGFKCPKCGANVFTSIR